MSNRGHSVQQTLIRAYFSPVENTCQRYIHAGTSCDSIFAWGVFIKHFSARCGAWRRVARDDVLVAGLAAILLGICLLHNESNGQSQARDPSSPPPDSLQRAGH